MSADGGRLVAVVRGVLDLHKRVDAAEPWCSECWDGNNGGGFVDYPCPTIRAIADALQDDDLSAFLAEELAEAEERRYREYMRTQPDLGE